MHHVDRVMGRRVIDDGAAFSARSKRRSDSGHGMTLGCKALMAALALACAPLAHAGQPVDAKPVAVAPASPSPCSAVKCTVTPSASNLQPTGGHIVSGTGHITQSGDTTDIVQTSSDLFLSWLSFNVGSEDTVNFVQPSASAIAVNRILGSNGSEILGHLNANGEVWLVNPNGIVFGEGAQVNVGGLIASTLSDVTLSGNSASFSGSGTGSIVNEGTINAANGGYVALLGNHVGNEGAISARLGTVALGAGSAVTLTFSGASLVKMQVDESTLSTLAENGGVIEADGGTVIMSAGAKDALLASVVNNTGVIEARTVENHDGTIELLGGMTAGTVHVGGTLDASAPDGGNGGLIETNAAHVEVANGAKVTTLAATGKTGSWLIDPTDYTVAPSGGDESGTTLSGALNSSNVTILSSSGTSPVTGGGSGGNINVNDTVSWSANTTLTLTAANNVNVNANVTATGNAAGLVINPNTANGSQAASGSGAFNLNIGNSITLSGTNPSLSIGGNAYTVISSLGAAGSTTGTDLQGMNGNLSGYYALGTNINATATSTWNSGAGFTPIGNPATAFTGSFNGLGHTISNLTINLPSTPGVGLFGWAGTGSAIQNVGLVGGSVSGSEFVGGLVGYNYEGTVSNSYAMGSVSGGSLSESVGGLVGYNDGTVSNSYATGSVSGASGSFYIGGLVGLNGGFVSDSYANDSVSGATGANSVGGLVGQNKYATVSNSYATGSVSGAGDNGGFGGLVGSNFVGTVTNSYATGSVSGSVQNVGGLVGEDYDGSVTNSYATGSVSGGSSNVGGLVGYNFGGGTVSNSYATGSVSGSYNVGGLVGSNDGTVTVTNSFWDTTTSGQASSAGGTGLTTAQMQTASNLTGFTFTTTPGASGNNWVIVDTDGTLNNAGGSAGATFPMLASEYSTTINNAHQLQLIAMNLGASYTLGQNIDASATGNSTDVWGSSGFVPIRNSSTAFTGTFNGLGHTISNLTINMPSTNYVGLFGWAGTGSVIQNVGLVGGSVSGFNNVGGLVGQNTGTVSNSYARVSVSGTAAVGGLVGVNDGTNSNSTVSNSYAAGSVSGFNNVGGLVGFNNFGTVTDSYATGSVSGSSSYIGGLVGYNAGPISDSYATGGVSVGSSSDFIGGLVGYNAGSISNSYATGGVSAGSGSDFIGGLVGLNTPFGTVTNAYSMGSVSGTADVGGLMGRNDGSVSNSFWDATTSGQSSSAGGTGMTTAQMQTQANFTSATSANGNVNPGWDFANTWVMYSGYTYPLLSSFMTPLTVTANSATTTYNQTAYSGGNGVTYSAPPNANLLGTVGYSGSSQGAINAGSYTIAPTGLYSNQQGYNITFANGTLTVNPAALTVSGESANNKVYDGTMAATLTGGTLVGVYSGDTVTLGESGLFASKNVGSGIGVTATDTLGGTSAGNYVLTEPAGLSANITPLALTGASIAAANSTYGSTVTPGAVSFTNEVAGDGILSTASIVTPTYSTSGNLNAGSYAQTASALSGANASNYTFAGYTTPSDNYTVGQLALTGAAIAAGNSIYGSSLTPGAVSFGNAIAGDDVSATASLVSPTYSTSNHLNAGSYAQTASALTGTDAGNYTFSGYTTATNNYTVTPFALTVTATGVNRTYDGLTDASVTLSDDRFAGDLLTDSYTSASFGNGNAGTGRKVNVSGISVTGTDAGNYTWNTAATTTANISRAVLTITADPATETYNGLGYSGDSSGVNYTGFVDGQTSSVLGGALGYSGNSQGAKNVGSYTIRPEGLTSPNYAITFATGTLMITKAPLTVAANGFTETYNGLAYSGGNGATYTGFVDGQSSSVLDGALGYAGTSQGATNAGTYVIRPKGLTSPNYAITFTNGTLTINKAPLTITADSGSVPFTGTPFSGGFGVTYSGFVDGQTASVLGGTLSYAGTSQGATAAGTYGIRPEDLTSSNYLITWVNGKLTIQ